MSQLEDWKNISKDFTDENSAIILGNGASIALHGGFKYSNLYEIAVKESHIKENLDKIFKHLDTCDFELVLRMLWHTNVINKALEIEDKKTTDAYNAVRNALITTVSDKNKFPDYQNNKHHLKKIAKFLKQFKIVISLNYDFLVYWSMLLGNKEYGQWFKDCFIKGSFDSNWIKYKPAYTNPPKKAKDKKAVGSTLVFYPHGNLILATDIYGEEIKIVTTEEENQLVETENRNLLDIILKKWTSNDYSPLFVSEGTSEQKKEAIQKQKAVQSSNYLKTVYEQVLPTLGSKIVIYGWSMSEQDDHILKAIAKGKIESIAVSVHTPTDDKCKTIKNKLQKIFSESKKELKDNQIIFFDSSSPGCWINEEKDNC